jgi:hypothetical protein
MDVTTIGLMITAFGVGIATWEAIMKYRELSHRLKVTFSAVIYPSLGEAKHAFSLSCANIGKRPIKITSYGIIIPNGDQLFIPWELESPCRLPVVLRDGEDCSLFINRNHVLDLLKEASYTGKVSIKPYFGDSSGKRHFAKKAKISLGQK